MSRLTVEEENLLCMYTAVLKDRIVEDIEEITRLSSKDMQRIGQSLCEKIKGLNDEEFKTLLGVIVLTEN